MTDLLQKIITTEDPGDVMKEAVGSGPVLRTLNQHIFYSYFSSYVGSDSVTWTAQVADTALQLLSGSEGIRYGRDWLLEIAFHGNLALAPINRIDSERFFRNFERIETALHALESDGPSRSSQYVKGLLAYARDDLPAAERAFSTLAELHDAPLLAHHAGYVAFRAPDFYRTLKNYTPDVRLSFVKETGHPSEASTVLLCAVDDLYFAAFADDFVDHALNASQSTHVHFHLIDNRIKPARLAKTDILSNDRVSITVEYPQTAAPGNYAIMARYIILPALLRRWRRPVLVTDVDLAMQQDPGNLKLDDSVTLRFNRHPAAAYIPASAVIGHHNLFQPDCAGMEFAQLLSCYLHYMCANNCALWTADQVALLMVTRMLRKIMPIGDFADIPEYRYSMPSDRQQKKKAAGERLKELSR